MTLALVLRYQFKYELICYIFLRCHIYLSYRKQCNYKPYNPIEQL